MGFLYNFSLQLICIVLVYFLINRKQLLYKSFYPSENTIFYLVFSLVFAYSLYTGFGGDNERYKQFVEGGYENFFYMDFLVLKNFMYLLLCTLKTLYFGK